MERKASKKKSAKKPSVKSKAKGGKAKEEKQATEQSEGDASSPLQPTECSTESTNAESVPPTTYQVQGKTITQAERDEIRDAYNVLSKDGNGKMGMKEVQKLLQSQFMTFTDNQAIEVFHKLDVDGDGEIDFEEFEKYVIDNNLNKPTCEEFGADMKDAFAMFDTDDNGYIDADEFKACMMMLGDKMNDEEVNEMMKEADTDGDGKIDYAEFCAHMSKAF